MNLFERNLSIFRLDLLCTAKFKNKNILFMNYYSPNLLASNNRDEKIITPHSQFYLQAEVVKNNNSLLIFVRELRPYWKKIPTLSTL